MSWLTEGLSVGVLDESGNGNSDQPLIVGVAIFSDFELVEQGVKDLFEGFKDSFLLEGLSSYQELLRKGFHAAKDPIPVHIEMMKFISTLKGCRILLVYSDRGVETTMTEEERIVSLYARLIKTAIRYFRTTEAHLIFESNSPKLDKIFPKIVGYVSAKYAADEPDRDRVQVNAEVAEKGDVLALAVIDYSMMVFSRWIRKGMPKDRKDINYRNFLAIERNIAWIECVESGLRSTRANREFH